MRSPSQITTSRKNKFNLIKFNYEQPKISYLFYPDFDIDPHPASHHSIQVELKAQTLQQRDYHNSPNPPILHRKETFVNSDYPHYQLFAQLTKQEEAIGLFHETHPIGTRKGWEQRLQGYHVELKDHQLKEYCAELQGHRLVWSKDADPETIKCVKAQRKSKKL